MTTRRTFLKTAILGGAAFTAGLELGGGLDARGMERVTLHGFLPADGRELDRLLTTFLAGRPGALPAPAVDAPRQLRAQVAGALRQAADRYVRTGDHAFDVQVTTLEAPLPADVMLQQDTRVVDPRSGFGRDLVALRERLRGRQAQLAVTCRLAPRPQATAAGRVLVVENERGVQERIALAGADRRLELAGPVGATSVVFGADGAEVAGASCRHRTCQRQGRIGQPGEMVACAPNRLVLRVEMA
ncbi:hypothetical protein GF314_03405 [bacterium]|nr:hypothetical protein [bacterium]